MIIHPYPCSIHRVLYGRSSKGVNVLKQIKTFQVDPFDFKLLAVQTAATVLFICKNRSPAVFSSPDEGDGEAYDPIAIILSTYQNWADNGYINSLQAMVELLYDYVQDQIDDTSRSFLLSSGDRRIITDALAAYQAWKTDRIAADKARLGKGYEHWGDATGFNQMDWSDLNVKFLGAVAV